MNLRNLLKKHKRNIKNSGSSGGRSTTGRETNDEHANSVIKNSISELESYIDEVATSIENRVADTKKQGDDDDDDKVTIAWQKIREFKGIRKTEDHNLDNGALKTQEIYFRDLAKEEPNKILAALYMKNLQTFVS